MLNVVFFGTPSFALPFLQALIAADDIRVVGVVAQPDRPKGRGHVLTAPETIVEARAHQIPTLQPEKIKTPDTFAWLEAHHADLFVVVAFGRILPTSLLNLPRLGCLNVHPSLLPRHRGPAPIPFTILAGDTTTGICVMKMDEGMDTGPLLTCETLPVYTTDTTPSLTTRILERAPQQLMETIHAYGNGTLLPFPQSEAGITLTTLLTKEDGHIQTHNMTAETILRRWRALGDLTGCWSTVTFSDGTQKRVVWKQLCLGHTTTDNTPSHDLFCENTRVFMRTQDQTLEVLELTVEGESPQSGERFVHSHAARLPAQIS